MGRHQRWKDSDLYKRNLPESCLLSRTSDWIYSRSACAELTSPSPPIRLLRGAEWRYDTIRWPNNLATSEKEIRMRTYVEKACWKLQTVGFPWPVGKEGNAQYCSCRNEAARSARNFRRALLSSRLLPPQSCRGVYKPFGMWTTSLLFSHSCLSNSDFTEKSARFRGKGNASQKRQIVKMFFKVERANCFTFVYIFVNFWNTINSVYSIFQKLIFFCTNIFKGL